jgi:hypothetical protein
MIHIGTGGMGIFGRNITQMLLFAVMSIFHAIKELPALATVPLVPCTTTMCARGEVPMTAVVGGLEPPAPLQPD